MNPLKKEEAIKLAEITSSIYEQGRTWVFKELDIDSGLTRLTRGLNVRSAKKRLKSWRKEKIELLLRGDGKSSAFVLREFHANPEWQGEGVWQWASNHWYTSQEEAEEALKKLQSISSTEEREEIISTQSTPLEVLEIKTENLPGHFSVL